MEKESPLTKEIEQAASQLLHLFASTPLQNRLLKNIPFSAGSVSISDLLAYQIGWGKLLINWYQAGLKNTLPQMPGEGFTTWDYYAIAKHFYQKHAHNQEKTFTETVQEILAIVQTETLTGNLDKTGVWAWCTLASGKEWPLSKWIRVNTVSPYKRACRLIRKHSL